MIRNTVFRYHEKTGLGTAIISLALLLSLVSVACGAAVPEASQGEFDSESFTNVPHPSPTPIPTQMKMEPESGLDTLSTNQPMPTNTPIEVESTEETLGSSFRSVSPDELLPFVRWGEWGGGGMRSECGDGIPNVLINPNDGGEPINDDYFPSPDEGVLGMQFIIEGCDFQNGEQVSVTFELPDGNIEETTTKAAEDPTGTWEVIWWSIPGEPFGNYNVIVESTSGVFFESFRVSPPPKPVLIVSCTKYQPKGLVILTGFLPQEEVLIAFYDNSFEDDSNLIDYGYVQIDPDGTAMFESPYTDEVLVAAFGQDRGDRTFFDQSGNEMQVSAYDYFQFPDTHDYCFK